MKTSMTRCLSLGLAIFYQDLVSGKIPAVQRIAPSDLNWQEFFTNLKQGDDIDCFSQFSGYDPQGTYKRTCGVKIKMLGKFFFAMNFVEVEGEWVFHYIDWAPDREQPHVYKLCF